MFKDTTITASAKKRELIIFSLSFLLAFALNVIGIIRHSTPVKELFTQLDIVLLISLVLYGLTVILRVLYHLVSRLWERS
jgi:uncharacterized membrane protein YczE